MFLKNICKKISSIILIVLILNLGLGNLLFIPKQVEACLDKNGNSTRNCYSCNSAGSCVGDSDGPYWCAQCFGKCSGSSSSSSVSISGPIDVNIIGPTPSCTPVNTSDFLDTISSIYGGEEMTNTAISTLIDIIQKDKKIPEELKSYAISSIQNAENIPENTKNLLIDKIQNNEKIPTEFKSLLIGAINDNKDITGLIKNWILDLLLKNISVEHICKSLTDTAATMVVFGTSVGTPMAMFITQICPIILNEIIQALLQTIPSPSSPENTQSISYPIFKSYKWEIGIPGLFKPGEVTEF